MPAISRFVLGRYRRLASGPQQQEFRELFRRYIALVYSERLAPYGGAHLTVTGARPVLGGTVVTSRVPRPTGRPVQIAWRMMRSDGVYKIVDVIVNGISMATTQRTEFASAIQRSGGRVAGLLATMRARLSGTERTPAAPAYGSGGPARR